MSSPFVRSPYNYDTNAASDETGLNTGQDGGAKQSFREECDINTIVKRFGLGYEIPRDVRIPQEGDFTGLNDFHQAMIQMRGAQEEFQALPADLRARFGNDPEQYVNFCLAEDNRDELAKYGMLSPEALKRMNDLKDEEDRKHEEALRAKITEELRGGTGGGGKTA